MVTIQYKHTGMDINTESSTVKYSRYNTVQYRTIQLQKDFGIHDIGLQNL